MLGYSYIETGDRPAKSVTLLKRYAIWSPIRPILRSLGEVLRDAGDGQGSLEHYAAALKIITNFYSSQIGLGDTARSWRLSGARSAYDRVATTNFARPPARSISKSAGFVLGRPAGWKAAIARFTLEQAAA